MAQEQSEPVRANARLDLTKWPTTIPICSSINEIFTSRCAANPPAGRRPIVISKAGDGRPSVKAFPEAYVVRLTAPDSTRWAQMVFEAGHEFGHIWVDPRIRDSWFVESVCMAFSHIALEEMAKEWSSYGRQPFVDYAPKFRKL